MTLQHRISEECTKILFKIENDNNNKNDTSSSTMKSEEFDSLLTEKYEKYKQQKLEKKQEYMAKYEFIALFALTNWSDNERAFLFEKTKLSFTIMCSDHCDSNKKSAEPKISLNEFAKWSHKFFPLATKQNYKRIFIALASSESENENNEQKSGEINEESSLIGSFGSRLRQKVNQKVVDYKNQQSQQLPMQQQSKQDIALYGGIGMQRFCEYVKELDLNFNIEKNECATVKASLTQNKESRMKSSERVLFHIKGVSDITGLPPYYGFVILSDYHLIFQGTALTTKTICINLNDSNLQIERAKVGGFLKRDTALKVVSEQGTQTWNIVNIKSKKRDMLFWSIWTMIRAHKLCANIDQNIKSDLLKKIKRRIIVEAADDVLRQNALCNVFEKDLKFDCVPFVRYATQSEKEKYVQNVKNELIAINEFNDSTNQSVMSSILSFGKNTNKSNDFFDPINGEKLKKYQRVKNDFKRQEECAKFEEFKSSKREDFDIRDFFNYLKILRIELEPLMFGIRMFQCIVRWTNPGLSLLIFLCLMLVAYMDYVHYIPACLFFANGVFLVSLKQDFEYTLSQCERALLYAGFDPNEFDKEKIAAERYAAQYKNNENGKKQWKVFNKIKQARYKYKFTQYTMGFHQKKLSDFSIFLGRFRTIYKWQKIEQSQIFCLFSICVGVILFFIPLRYVFAASVFAVFFKHNPWRNANKKSKKGAFDRYFESIPPDIPEIDSENEESDNEEEEKDNEEESFIDRIRKRAQRASHSSDENGSA